MASNIETYDADTCEVNMAIVWALVEDIMHSGVGKADRVHAAATCLLLYFILVSPDPLPRPKLEALMEEASDVLMPVALRALMENNGGGLCVTRIPTEES